MDRGDMSMRHRKVVPLAAALGAVGFIDTVMSWADSHYLAAVSD